MNERSEMLRHIPELDGIRGIAVLAVMIGHFYDPVQAQSPFGPLTRAISCGGCGVDLFFVLSGYLITGILVSSRTAVNYFRAFYARRALRIFPLYFLVVALFFWLIVPLSQHHDKLLWIRPSEQIWYWLFLANWRVGLGYNDGAQLSHFWSLAIEEQFYLVWSVVVWVCSSRQLRWVSVAAVAGAMLGRVIGAAHGLSDVFQYRSTVTRMDALALGALLAIWPEFREFFAKIAPYLLPVCIVGALFHPPTATALMVYDVGATALVGIAVTREVHWLRLGWLRTFGKYSYALYLLHYLIHGVLTPLAPRFNPFVFAVGSIVGGIGVSFGCAWVSWNVLEHPFLRLKRFFKYRFPGGGPEERGGEPAAIPVAHPVG